MRILHPWRIGGAGETGAEPKLDNIARVKKRKRQALRASLCFPVRKHWANLWRP